MKTQTMVWSLNIENGYSICLNDYMVKFTSEIHFEISLWLSYLQIPSSHISASKRKALPIKIQLSLIQLKHSFTWRPPKSHQLVHRLPKLKSWFIDLFPWIHQILCSVISELNYKVDYFICIQNAQLQLVWGM